MRNIILFMCLILLLSCYKLKNGYIIQKIEEPINYRFYKNEITYEEPYRSVSLNMNGGLTTSTRYRTVYTGRYNYYKSIDNIDYIFILENVNKKDKKIQQKIYIEKNIYANYKLNDFIKLEEVTNSLFDYNNMTIEISKDEYLRIK